MLLTKKYKDNDIISLKLSSGEEILGRFVREDDQTIYITKPSVLMMNPQGMGMVPFMFTVNPDDEYSLNKSAVITHAHTDSDIAKQYLSKTSGIALG